MMGALRAVIDLPASVHSPATARHVVCELADAWGLPDLTEDAQLIASELVTNATRHGPGSDPIELEVIHRGERLRIAVVDRSADRPQVLELSPEAPSGRGMAIVVALSSDWGADDHHSGKRVWADLDHAVR